MPRKVDFNARVKKVLTTPGKNAKKGESDVGVEMLLGDLEITDADLLRAIQFQGEGMVKVELTPIQLKFGDDEPKGGLNFGGRPPGKKKTPRGRKPHSGAL